jgi:hypothetical protein
MVISGVGANSGSGVGANSGSGARAYSVSVAVANSRAGDISGFGASSGTGSGVFLGAPWIDCKKNYLLNFISMTVQFNHVTIYVA